MNGARRGWWPSPGVWLWMAFFLALTFSPQRIALIAADGDPCWHWRQGNWMLEHRALLRADEFSHTRPGAPLIEMWWLSEVLFAAAGNALGWNGVVVLSAALIATTLGLLYRYIVRETNAPLLALGATLLAAAAGASHWLARPHLFTHLFVVVFAGELRGFSTGRASARRLLVGLPLLMLLWANLHGAFVTGLVLIACYLAGQVATLVKSGLNPDTRCVYQTRLQTLALLLGLCLIASLLNPAGWRLHAHVLAYLRNPVLVGFVDEYASPNFHEPAQLGLLLLLLALLLTLVSSRPVLPVPDFLLLAGLGYLALQSVRNGPTFALVTAPILAAQLRGRWPGMVRSAIPGRNGWVWIPVTLLITVMWGLPRLPTELPAHRYPRDAVRFLQASPAAVSGEMFNDIIWGGYFLLAMPERKVFIDGRIDFYGEQVIEDFNRIDEVRPGWETVAARYAVGWTILPPAHRLNQVLALHPDWTEAYRDEVAVIFTRRGE